MTGLEVTLRQEATDAPVHTQIWCPAFVDAAEHENVEEALAWAQTRLQDTDPFAEYAE